MIELRGEGHRGPYADPRLLGRAKVSHPPPGEAWHGATSAMAPSRPVEMGAGWQAEDALLDSGEERWQDRLVVEDIFHRKRKPKRILLVASFLFGVTALASLVAAVQGEPLRLGEEIVASGVESLCYRIAATFLTGLLGGWLFFRSLPPKSEADQLTG